MALQARLPRWGMTRFTGARVLEDSMGRAAKGASYPRLEIIAKLSLR